MSNKPKANFKQVLCQIPEDLHGDVKAECQVSKISMAQFFRYAITGHLKAIQAHFADEAESDAAKEKAIHAQFVVETDKGTRYVKAVTEQDAMTPKNKWSGEPMPDSGIVGTPGDTVQVDDTPMTIVSTIPNAPRSHDELGALFLSNAITAPEAAAELGIDVQTFLDSVKGRNG